MHFVIDTIRYIIIDVGVVVEPIIFVILHADVYNRGTLRCTLPTHSIPEGNLLK